MKKSFLLISAAIALAGPAFAQKENNVWVFGDQSEINFNTTPPTISAQANSIVCFGSSASVSDANGQLLFYTSGDTLWDRNNNIMPNGSGLIAPYSAAQSDQGQLILPTISNPNQYYVFSAEGVGDNILGGDPFASRVFYSIVDMSLNNGMGDVVQNSKGIPLDSAVTGEKMIGIPGTDCSVWLLLHDVDGPVFKAYRVTDTGISTSPVISTCGNLTGEGYFAGLMKASPDGRHIVTSNWMWGNFNSDINLGLETYNFDPSTGIVSNAVGLDSIPRGLSACFSPDASKLYYIAFNGILYQYDMSQPTTAGIINSRITIDSLQHDAGIDVYDAQIGPDGKVYVFMTYDLPPYDTIACVNAPNLAGTACNYVHAALVSSQPVFEGNQNLPNLFVRPLPDTSTILTDTSLSATGSVTLYGPSSNTAYLWSNGDTTATITVSDTGTYWVIATAFCSYTFDTFHVAKYAEGIGNISTQSGGFSVYPNPASSDMTVSVSYQNASGRISIINVLGQTVLTTHIQDAKTNVNIANLAAGTYQVIYINDKTPTKQSVTSLVVSK